MHAVLLLTLATGCSLLAGPEAPAGCGFPDGTRLAFAGESSLAELNLGDGSIIGGGRIIDDTVGTIYVTNDAVPYAGSRPMTPNGPADVPDHRQYCAIYGDITAIGGVPVDWKPPGS
jgi:hypothetical protein